MQCTLMLKMSSLCYKKHFLSVYWKVLKQVSVAQDLPNSKIPVSLQLITKSEHCNDLWINQIFARLPFNSNVSLVVCTA